MTHDLFSSDAPAVDGLIDASTGAPAGVGS